MVLYLQVTSIETLNLANNPGLSGKIVRKIVLLCNVQRLNVENCFIAEVEIKYLFDHLRDNIKVRI